MSKDTRDYIFRVRDYYHENLLKFITCDNNAKSKSEVILRQFFKSFPSHNKKYLDLDRAKRQGRIDKDEQRRAANEQKRIEMQQKKDNRMNDDLVPRINGLIENVNKLNTDFETICNETIKLFHIVKTSVPFSEHPKIERIRVNLSQYVTQTELEVERFQKEIPVLVTRFGTIAAGVNNTVGGAEVCIEYGEHCVEFLHKAITRTTTIKDNVSNEIETIRSQQLDTNIDL